MTDRTQLHHLADRARRGVLLPAEGALLADAITALEQQLTDQASSDDVARRAAQAIAGMGADIRAIRAERDQYRAAWKSARHRAALYLQSNQKLSASLDNGHAAQLHAQRVAQSAARDAADALTRQLAAEQRAEQAEAAIARALSPDGIRAAREALTDEALTRLGRDLGTIHAEDIATATVRAALGTTPAPGTVTITQARHQHLIAGQCIHHQETHRLHHGEPVPGCPYPGCHPEA